MNRKHWKKWLLAGTAILLAAGVAAGSWIYSSNSGKSVNVYPFRYIGMTEFWGDSQESYGPVSAENIQTVFLSDTQTVTQILVSAGDSVKQGDVLMTFDTSLSELALERKRLDMEKKKLQLKEANDYLIDLGNMKPMEIPKNPGFGSGESMNLGTELKDRYAIFTAPDYDGSSAEKAVICWIRDDVSIDDDILEAIRVKAEEQQKRNALRPASSASAEPEPLMEEITQPTEETTEHTEETTQPTEETTEPTEETTQPTEETTEPTEETTQPTEETTEPTEETTEPTQEATEPTDENTEPTEESPGSAEGPTEPEGPVEDFYAVFKMTEGNMSLGGQLLWQGLHVKGSGTDFRIGFFSAFMVPDHSLEPKEEEEAADSAPGFDFGSGYTAAQLAQMRSEQKKKIKELELTAKMAEAEYKLMLLEVQDGNVYAQLDGEVVSLLTEEEARLRNEPILKVSAGGGFYVQGNVSELVKEQLKPGQEVTVNDWNTGMMYTGMVASVGDFPVSEDSWNGMGNPNASYYPFQVFVDGEANLQAGRYVSMTYSTSGAESGIYLENPFLRSEQGRYYVYVMGADGRLEKRFVSVGKSLWGSYREIISGISENDLLAFPYGKDVKEGAPAVESDLSELYGQ